MIGQLVMYEICVMIHNLVSFIYTITLVRWLTVYNTVARDQKVEVFLRSAVIPDIANFKVFVLRMQNVL